MVHRALLATLIVVVAAFAGCADNGGGGAPTPGTSPATTTPGTTTPGTTPTTSPPGGQTTYVVGTDAAFPPFEDIDAQGNYVGYDIDVMQEIATRNGWTIEWRNVVFDVLIEQIRQGQIDMAISAMTIRPDRAEAVDFSLPYFVAENQAVTRRADETRTFESLDDLAGLRVGVQAGTTGQFYMEDEFGEATVVRYDTYPLALQALRVGEVDVVVMDQPAQERAAADDAAIEIAFLFEVNEEYGIAVRKGNSQLLDAINDALTDMIDDGTITTLRTKWGV
ncbi:MAG TPA: basic amino acid ABC transporter substrate-binding protein [Candidatus Thermoplasmatota archaeon]|nr:basic amino acid ABC transporter substrate-binding protein [Candidatus Thermoplasmatota archaeon]